MRLVSCLSMQRIIALALLCLASSASDPHQGLVTTDVEPCGGGQAAWLQPMQVQRAYPCEVVALPNARLGNQLYTLFHVRACCSRRLPSMHSLHPAPCGIMHPAAPNCTMAAQCVPCALR